jgi:polar amino acid transport system permease protein
MHVAIRGRSTMNYQFQFDAVFAAWPLLLKGTWITIQLSLIATVLGLVVAIFAPGARPRGRAGCAFSSMPTSR